MNPQKIVCMGDSLTEGYGIENASDWPAMLNKAMYHEIINSGISGDTTAGMLARFHTMVIAHKPNYVIIMGGVNDISIDIPENQIIGNILAMTRLARHHNIQSIIGIPPPFFLPEIYEDDSLFIQLPVLQKRLIDYQQTLKRYITNDEQPSIDFSLNMAVDLYLQDGLHPNEKGHEMMAKNANEQLVSIFETK